MPKWAGIKGRTGIFTTEIICVVGDKKLDYFLQADIMPVKI